METLEIKAEFKKRKKKQFLLAIPMIPSILLVAFMQDFESQFIEGIPNIYLLFVALVIIIAGLIISIFNWRCPSCNKYLGKKFNPKFCSNCGVELR